MLLTKLRALVAGEEPADTLEAYRHAGLAVFDLVDQVESRHLARKIDGSDPWSASRADQLQALCAWNAFLLQTVGDAFLAEDYRFDPTTVGYVPPPTAEQALACYSQVEGWLSRAAQAQGNPDYPPDVALPADLPAWKRTMPCPVPHIEALLAAMRAARTHATAALATFEQDGLPAEKQAAVQRLRQLVAEATTTGNYAERLWEGKPPQSLHPRVEQDARTAIVRFYLLGQLLAMPGLLDAYAKPRPEPALGASATAAALQVGARVSVPGDPGFDPWCLTDPGTKERWRRDPAAREAIDRLWASDPDPRQTLAVYQEIVAALAVADIAYATNAAGQSLGPYYMAPWSAIFTARRALTLGGKQLDLGQQFTYELCIPDVPSGVPFRRRILVGTFHGTEEVMYGHQHAMGSEART